MKKTKNWKTYEEVARFLLDDMADEFGLDKFEGKQKIKGNRSGTMWEIDGKGISVGNDVFFIVECRRYTTSKQKQENVAALAYRIRDIGADGGFVVSPLGLQEGAKKVATAENIHEILLSPDSTTANYLIKFLNQFKVGITNQVGPMTDSLEIKIYENGALVDNRKV